MDVINGKAPPPASAAEALYFMDLRARYLAHGGMVEGDATRRDRIALLAAFESLSGVFRGIEQEDSDPEIRQEVGNVAAEAESCAAELRAVLGRPGPT
jgi:hypothetical protein